MSEPGVKRVVGDQCLYGCEAESGSPVKKPTGFMTNTPELGKELAMRCSGRSGNCSRPEGGTHAQCRGKTARMASMYHVKLCRAILVGSSNQLTHDGTCNEGFIGMLDSNRERSDIAAQMPLHNIPHASEVFEVQIDSDTIYRDDLTGQVLDPALVGAARQKELDFFEAKEVWTK